MDKLFEQIRYMIFMLPYLIFMEGSEKWAAFLKKRGTYEHWDVWHSLLLVLVILAIVLYRAGFR
jgi:hypothetical protein